MPDLTREQQLAGFDRNCPPGSLSPGARSAMRGLIERSISDYDPLNDTFRLTPSGRLMLATQATTRQEKGLNWRAVSTYAKHTDRVIAPRARALPDTLPPHPERE